MTCYGLIILFVCEEHSRAILGELSWDMILKPSVCLYWTYENLHHEEQFQTHIFAQTSAELLPPVALDNLSQSGVKTINI